MKDAAVALVHTPEFQGLPWYIRWCHYITVTCQVLVIGGIMVAAMVGLSQIFFGWP